MDPHQYEMIWKTGEWKTMRDDQLYFIKDETIFRKTLNCDETLFKCSTIMRRLDILENLRLIMLSLHYTGGLEYVPLSKTMSKDVEHANDSKLTETPLTPLIYLLKGLDARDPLQK